MFCNATEMSTSAAVTEISLVYGLMAGAFSLLNLNFLGILFLSLMDVERNSSIESNSVFAFSTAWMMVIEFALFLGMLCSTFVILFSVIL